MQIDPPIDNGHDIYLRSLTAALRRRHRAHWWRRNCTCGEPLPCQVLDLALAEVLGRSGAAPPPKREAPR